MDIHACERDGFARSRREPLRLVTREWFDENALAIVFADIKVRDHQMLQSTAISGVRP